MRISQPLLDELIEHALAEAPNECCGMIGMRDGEAVAVHRAKNIHASPLKYEIGPQELLRLTMAIEDAGLSFGANYHSHTRTPPVPSPTDINIADIFPNESFTYVIVGLAGAEPEVRAFSIFRGRVSEQPIEITPGGAGG